MKRTKTLASALFITIFVAVVFLTAFLVKTGYEFWKLRQSSAGQPAEPALVVAKMTHEQASSTYYTLNLSYPTASSTTLPEIAEYIASQKSEFLQNFKTITPKDATFMGLDRNPWELYATTTTYTSARTVSYVLKVYSYTGGAHGITVVKTFTYDARGKKLSLGDVLVENPSLYITLASSAQAYFAQKFPEGDADAVAIGASANPDNFSNWYETNEGIVFLFGEYAIGPYSLGIQEFPFSRKEYKNLFTAAYE